MEKGYKILVVDDNKIIISLVKHILDSDDNDYMVYSANNGKEAFDKALKDKPDLILMDLFMPVMDGIEALNLMKSHPKLSDVPIIMLTSSKKVQEAFESGANDYIKKPIDKTELIVRVRSTLALFKLLNEIITQSKELEQQSVELENQKKALESEKKKTDILLRNILPYEIAEQLKTKGTVQAKHYRKVSVLFTDFKGFTKIAEKLTSDQIVKELSICFEKFDEIIEAHYIEKIKTIGDSYMCAGGLPIRNKSNPIDITLAGLKIQHFMNQYNKAKRALHQPQWQLRLGIHTGEVVAGVIGKKKFAYDIWGDTVNTASRMESGGEPGKVNISGETHKFIKNFFDCIYRGKIQVKNKGLIDMYFVEGLKKEYAVEGSKFIPNKKFREILSYY